MNAKGRRAFPTIRYNCRSVLETETLHSIEGSSWPLSHSGYVEDSLFLKITHSLGYTSHVNWQRKSNYSQQYVSMLLDTNFHNIHEISGYDLAKHIPNNGLTPGIDWGSFILSSLSPSSYLKNISFLNFKKNKYYENNKCRSSIYSNPLLTYCFGMGYNFKFQVKIFRKEIHFIDGWLLKNNNTD